MIRAPWRYWETDPQGWLRHVIVGVIFGIWIALTPEGKKMIPIACLVLITLGKEVYDYQAKGFAQVADIVFTFLGAIPGLIRGKTTAK